MSGEHSTGPPSKPLLSKCLSGADLHGQVSTTDGGGRECIGLGREFSLLHADRPLFYKAPNVKIQKMNIRIDS